MKYKYIMWDWNGTILDDAVINFETVNALLLRRDLKPMESLEQYRQIFDFPVIDFYKIAGFDLEREKFEAIAKEYVLEYEERFYESEIFEDIQNLIRDIKFAGVMQMILSATQQSMLEKQVRFHDMDYLFTDILGVKDVYGKSKVDIALRWITENNIDAADVLFVGDTTHDFLVAENIGCDCVLIARGHHCYEKLADTGAKVIENAQQLRELVLK